MKAIDQLSDEAVLALGAFIAAQGARWRARLGQAFETGDYPAGAHVPQLQRLRNTVGPEVVFKLNGKEVTKAAQEVAAVRGIQLSA